MANKILIVHRSHKRADLEILDSLIEIFKFGDTLVNMNYFQIKRKLIPVLKKGDLFNFEKAKVEVKNFIDSLMILNEDEKKFVNQFRNKIYGPSLLFENKEILERIISHPMVILNLETDVLLGIGPAEKQQ